MGQLKGQEQTTRVMSADLVSHDQGVAPTDNRDILTACDADNDSVQLPDLLQDIGPSPQRPHHGGPRPVVHMRSVSCQVDQKKTHHQSASSSMVTRTSRTASRRSRRGKESQHHTTTELGSKVTELTAEDRVKTWKMKNLAASIQVNNKKPTTEGGNGNNILSDMMNQNVCMLDSTKSSVLWSAGITDKVTSLGSCRSSSSCTTRTGLNTSSPHSGGGGRRLLGLGGHSTEVASSRNREDEASGDYPEVICNYTQVTGYDETLDQACQANAMALLRVSGSYYGKLSMQEARQRLKRSSVGTYLLRDTSDSNYFLSLSVKTQRGTTSIRISFARGRFRLDCEETALLKMPSFDCLMKLIQYYNASTAKSRGSHQSCVFLESTGRKDTPVLLSRPYLEEPLSLKHMCRCTLNRVLNEDQRRRLLIFMSPDIEEYLLEYPYFV